MNEVSQLSLIVAIIIGFSIVFPMFWIAIVFLISRLSGWSSLAKVYPGHINASGQAFNWHSARFGFAASYKNSLNITVSHQGLHMMPMVLFKFGHMPICIPWHAISNFTKKDYWFTQSGMIVVKDINDGSELKTFTVYGRSLIEAIEQKLV